MRSIPVNRTPVLAGALAQAIAVGWVYLALEGATALLIGAGVVGGLVAGTVSSDPGDGWIDGAVASSLGMVVFLGAFLLGGAAYAARFGEVVGSHLFVSVYAGTATLLAWFLVPIYAMLGLIGGLVAATAVDRYVPPSLGSR